jgi:glycosyltransferase involved in cell wall biosynthesis
MLRRALITLDAVGGVWRYAIDVARGLKLHGVECMLVGFGPEPDPGQRGECGCGELVWTHEPLDWTVSDSAQLHRGTDTLAGLARDWDADILHVNLPSLAAGLPDRCPIVVASHSCVPTWWHTVQGTDLPAAWAWQVHSNRAGLQRADAVVVPSRSHAAALNAFYRELPPLHVIHNATALEPGDMTKEPPRETVVLGVGRWWDPGKNGAILDEAAATSPWPVILAGPLTGPNGQRTDFRNVRTLGTLPHSEILALMRRSAIFAAPSRYEPFGLAVVEAAISGAALVLADIPTFRELWSDTALFVDSTDSNGWSRALAALAADTVLRERLSAAAGARARQFTLSRQSAQLYGLYSSLTTPAAPA